MPDKPSFRLPSLSSIGSFVGGIAAALIFIYSFILNDGPIDSQLEAYVENHSPAPKTPAIHSGFLEITAVDNKTKTNQSICEIFVYCGEKVRKKIVNGLGPHKFDIKECDVTEINAKLCNSSNWLVDGNNHTLYGSDPLTQEQYTLIVNDIPLNAKNVGRSGNYYNYFVNLQKKAP